MSAVLTLLALPLLPAGPASAASYSVTMKGSNCCRLTEHEHALLGVSEYGYCRRRHADGVDERRTGVRLSNV